MAEPLQPARTGPAVLLAIGDIHLGTRCSGLPKDLSSWGIGPDDLTPAAALEASVEFAVRNRVDAVLFAGDVVESTNARFEAMVPLERAVRHLLDAHIQVIAVAGNHDVEALPRLARLIDGFTLLGAGGQWESCIVARDGENLVEIVGWSFAEPKVLQSPVALLLTELLAEGSSALPRIGLLHADLDASGGAYAPIKQRELDETGFDAWLLGHIHKPSLSSGAHSAAAYPCGYLGSLIGLDPTETGPHGPWLVTVSGRGDVAVEHQPLAPLRWERLSVAVGGVEDVEDVPDLLLSQAEERVRQLGRAGGAPRALGLRVRLEGASENYEEIRRNIAGGEWHALVRLTADTAVFINKVTDGMELRLELAEMAKGDDPLALMARRILSLQRNDAEASALLAEVRLELIGVVGENILSPLREQRDRPDPLSDAALRETLLQAAKLALHAMLDQRSGDKDQ